MPISIHTRSSATAETAHDANVGAHSIRKYSVQPTPIKFVYALLSYLVISICVNNDWPSLQIHTPPLLQVKLEKDSWE